MKTKCNLGREKSMNRRGLMKSCCMAVIMIVLVAGAIGLGYGISRWVHRSFHVESTELS